MRTKSRLLLPAGVLAAAILGTACGPPPINPPPTTTTLPAPTGCPAATNAAPGPDTQNPASSGGVNGQAFAAAVIGNVAYVGGSFTQAFSLAGAPSPKANLAAFCLANGELLSTFTADFGGGVTSTAVKALATDGTSLFVGGEFTTMNGGAVNRLVKLDAQTGARITAFAPKTIPAQVNDLAYYHDANPANDVLYAAGDFGKLGVAPPASNLDYVGNAAGFNPTSGTWTGWFAGTNKPVSSIAVNSTGTAVWVGGIFTEVKKPAQGTPGTARDRLAKLDTSGAGSLVAPNYGVVGADVTDLAVDIDNASLFAALGTGAAGTGHRVIYFNGAAAQNWNNNNFKGNAQALTLIGNRLYEGFLGGYDDGPTGPLTLQPAQYRVLGVDFTVGPGSTNHVPQPGFSPAVVAPSPTSGVFGLAMGSNQLVAVGDFTSMGTTINLHGVAIFG